MESLTVMKLGLEKRSVSLVWLACASQRDFNGGQYSWAAEGPWPPITFLW